MRPGLDERGTVAVQRDARLRRPAPVSVHATCHALPDQVAAVAHGAWLRGPPFPAEPRRSFRQTLAHGARGERAAGVWIDLGVVEQA